MRFTYIKTDKIIGINGIFLTIDNSSFNQEVDAIQWYDTYGEIEFINRQERNNEFFEDINYIQSLIDLWNVEKINQDQLIAEQEKKAQQDKLNLSTIQLENQKLLDKINSVITT
jgi:hypothetical protein